MGDPEEFWDESAKHAPVEGFLHRTGGPNADAIVLTHGAGANCQTPLLLALAQAFSAAGMSVLRCDLPFRQLRPNGPPPRGSAEKDQAGLRAAVAAMRRETAGRIFLAGHSYGGRQASLLAAAEPGLVKALLLLSYPLHPPHRPDQMRTTHFPSLQTPALFVTGARDGFGTEEEMKEALQHIPAPTELLMVPGAGHELMNARNRSALPKDVVAAFRAFASAIHA
jgi:predicted alpha/beta-hydrolase family hydrolase